MILCLLWHLTLTCGIALDQSFSLRFSRRKGASFVGWFSRQLENRNHISYVSCYPRDGSYELTMIQLDTTHNDQDTVWRNVYLNLALTAMKIPHYFSGDITPHHATIIYSQSKPFASLGVPRGIVLISLQNRYALLWNTHTLPVRRECSMPHGRIQ